MSVAGNGRIENRAENLLLDEVMFLAARLPHLTTPAEILAELGRATWEPLHVLGAARLPLVPRDWPSAKLGRTVFLCPDRPKLEWWEEYIALCRSYADQDLMMARSSLAPFTWTESRRMLEPIGIDRWPYDLAMKHGMRDGLTCPVGGRWMIVFWSPRVLGHGYSQERRAIIFLAANFAALRLQQIVPADPFRLPRRAQLTSRELAVLRLAALGRQVTEMAAALGLGAETVRTHLKKAQDKLGSRNRTQAVAEALRQHLIP